MGVGTKNNIISTLENWDYEKFDRNRVYLAIKTKEFLLNNVLLVSNKSLLGFVNE